MAVQKEEIILSIEVDQKDAISELEQLKKSITQTKQEQAELNKAFKAGNITLDEYAADSVRLEGILKRNQSVYNSVQKSVTGVKTQLDKLIDSNKKISKSFEDAASNINVAGVNVGSLSTRLAGFVNPATAAVGIAGALGSAYARSTIGAKDLEFAQNQLTAAITLTTNAFAGLISSSEDGQGIVSTFIDDLIFRFSPETAALSKLSAFTQETLEDLVRKEIEIRDQVNNRLEENQELLTKIQSEQTKYNEKVDDSNVIITNLKRNEEELRNVLEEELGTLQLQLSLDSENEGIQTLILQKKREISRLESDTEKKVQAIVRLQQNLNQAEEKRLKLLQDQKAITESGNRPIDITSGLGLNTTGVDKIEKPKETFIKEGTLAVVDEAKISAEAIAEIQEGITDNQRRESDKRVKITKAQTDLELSLYSSAASAIAGIFKEGSDLQKTFALISIGVDTAEAISGLTSASENNPANAYTFGAAGAAQFAAGLIRIFSAIGSAQAYLAGGGDFLTQGPTMLMVGDNPGGVERVTVEPISGRGQTKVDPYSNLIAMAGGGTLTTGGNAALLANSLTAETNQALITANALKRQPKPIVAVRDIKRGLKNVEVKDMLSKAG